MRDHVDPLTFVKLPLHVKEVFAHCLTLTKLINQEQVFLLIYFVNHQAYLFPLYNFVFVSTIGLSYLH